MVAAKEDLIAEIEKMLRRDPSKLYSKEEILNLLAARNKDVNEIEHLLAGLEIASSIEGSTSNVYSTCRGSTVYYKWNKAS